MKETYENVKQLLSDIKHDDHKWKICCDLKMVAIMLGFQTGYTKYMCFLCVWDSRARSLHWEKKDWRTRESYVPGVKNVLHPKLVNEKDIMPLLHIKLSLMKNFVKKLDRTGHTLLYLGTKFPKLSEAKIKEGVFVGPQIRELLYLGGYGGLCAMTRLNVVSLNVDGIIHPKKCQSIFHT